MSDEAIELADRTRDADPATEWMPAAGIVKGDRVLYLGLAVTVTQVDPRLDWIRIAYRLDEFEGYFTVPPTWPLARLLALQPTAPGSDPRAAERADDTAQNGA